MGANAQTSVPTFTAGEVLTAANMNISARTGIPVFATSTTRDAAFGGTGEKTLAEGQFAYLEDSNTTQYYDGAAWQSVGVAPGLTLIKTQTIGTTVSTVAVSDAFSATYENYRIIVTGGVGSTTTSLTLILGATTTGYYEGIVRIALTQGDSTADFKGNNNGSAWDFAGEATTDGINSVIELQQPFATKRTTMQIGYSSIRTNGNAFSGAGYLNNATSYTGFTYGTATGTLTGGTIFVYGYKLS
jgi:hypothetical protein